MIRRALSLALIFSGALCLPAWGDEFHYNSILVGDRPSGMGGAYTAVSDDSSGMYYNPAGIVDVAGSSVSASVNAYQNITKEYKGVIGGNDWKRTSSALLPNYFGILQPLGPIRAGFSYAVPEDISEDQDQTFNRFDVPGVDKFVINFKNHDRIYNFGPSVAGRVSGNLSAGLTLYVHKRSSDQVNNQLTFFSNGQSTWLNTFQRTDEWGVRPILGLMWTPVKKVSLGMALSRTWVVTSDTRVQASEKNVAGDLSFINPSSSADRREYPYEIRLGAAYFPSAQWLISADLIYHTAVKYSILGLEHQAEAVWDGAVGVEYFFSRRWALRGGLFTNRSNAPDIKGTELGVVEKIDVYGASTSLTYFIRATSISLGASYSLGNGRAHISAGPQVDDATYQSWAIFLSSSSSF